MSLRFHYKLVPIGRPIVPLGGRTVRPRPVIPITIIGPTETRVRDALLDTGADDTVFSETLAATIGIDLTHAPAGSGASLGGLLIPLRYAEVVLRIAGLHEQREWKAWVGFAASGFRRPILGFAGFLQYFSATFSGDPEKMELTVNSLYPGT